MEVFCFALGILFVYYLNPISLLIVLVFFYLKRSSSLLYGLFLGIGVACIHQWLILPQGMPDTEIIPKAIVQGKIVSIPIRTANKTSFLFKLEQLNNHPAKALIQLSWYNRAPVLKAGQIRRLEVKLKKPRNFNNPGSFDYVSSLNSKHIFWTGYVRSQDHSLIQDSTSVIGSWLRLRELLGEKIQQIAPDERTTGIMQALSLNMTQHISQKDWELFRRTGTVHLFGISGEHIALVSGLLFYIFNALWSRSTVLCLYIPAPYIASIGAFLTASGYSFLAGFGPPVQRALIGCFLYSLCCIGRKKLSSWQIWRYALVCVLCIEPHAVFMQGFYFSFLAVACILLTHQLWSLKGLKKSLLLQLSCLIGLMPLSLYWFSYASINGYLANVITIPLVGLFLVPLILLFLVLIPLGASYLIIKPIYWLTLLLFQCLTWTEQLSFINLDWSFNSLGFTLSLMAAFLLILLLPIKPFKNLAILWGLLSCIPQTATVNQGEALIRVLDVGQGLAIAVQTATHTLLYDTGDQFFKGNDLGNLVILPYYQRFHIKVLDKVIISHPDKDHRGGLKSIEAKISVKELLVNDPAFYHRGQNCHEYPDWNWDGVSFHFFPLATGTVTRNKNNSSCILQISNAQGKVLLTGDIEKGAEDYLVKHYQKQLSSQVLIVPHHGSKTSSSYRFLLEVSPLFAIASLGFDNRFHFPHAQTLKKLKSLGIDFYRTDICGMVEVRLPVIGGIKRPRCFALNHSASTTL